MIKEAAYNEGYRAAWGVFFKGAAPMPTQVFRGPRVAAQTNSAPVMGAAAPVKGPSNSAAPGPMLPQQVGPGVTKKPQPTAPVAAPAAGAGAPAAGAPAAGAPAAGAPAAGAPAAGAPAAGGKPAGFFQNFMGGVKGEEGKTFGHSLGQAAMQQAPMLAMSAGLPLMMNAFSSSGNQNNQY